MTENIFEPTPEDPSREWRMIFALMKPVDFNEQEEKTYFDLLEVAKDVIVDPMEYVEHGVCMLSVFVHGAEVLRQKYQNIIDRVRLRGMEIVIVEAAAKDGDTRLQAMQ